MPGIKEILYVLGCSMLPVIELRGSIILAAGLNFPWYLALIIGVIGSFLPAPFILLFIRQILKWMKKFKYTEKIAVWIENKAHKHSAKVLKYASLGLFIFVAIPLPGTGAWTGSLIASLLDMRFKYALPSIFFGVLAAGVIMTGVAYGFIGFLSFLM